MRRSKIVKLREISLYFAVFLVCLNYVGSGKKYLIWKIFCAVSTGPNDEQKPGVELEHLPTPRIGSENMLLTDGETSSALATGGINSELIQEMDRDKKMEVKTLSEILSCWESSRKQLY